LEHKLDISTTNAKQEKEIINQIKFLRESTKYMVIKEDIYKQIRELRGKKKEVAVGLDELKSVGKSISNEIDALKIQRASQDDG
jgi:hypothetical protein